MAEDKVKPEVKKPDYYNVLDKSVIDSNEITTLGKQTGAGVILLVLTKTENGTYTSLQWVNQARIEPFVVHGEVKRYNLVGGI